MKATVNKAISKPSIKPLTKKQQIFVQHLVDNPKASAAEAARQAYNLKGTKKQIAKTSSVIAAENLAKPSIVTELSKYNNLIENTLINTINDYKESEKLGQRTLAVDTAKYVHDKIHGRAKQQLDVNTTSVSINIDLTGAPEAT